MRFSIHALELILPLGVHLKLMLPYFDSPGEEG
jgi:hypothetical protein